MCHSSTHKNIQTNILQHICECALIQEKCIPNEEALQVQSCFMFDSLQPVGGPPTKKMAPARPSAVHGTRSAGSTPPRPSGLQPKRKAPPRPGSQKGNVYLLFIFYFLIVIF